MNARQTLLLAGAVVAGLVLGGCGSAQTEAASTAPTVSGAVASDAPVASVALRDAAHPGVERMVAPDAAGNFSVDVGGLTAPFLLRAGSGDAALYAIALRPGNADINGLTSVAVAGTLRGTDDGEGSDHAWGDDDHEGAAARLGDVLRSLRTVLKPLFDRYGVTRIGGDDDGDVSGMRALLRDVSFTVQQGVVTVTNRATGGVIFTGKLSNLAAGVFHPENMPAGPGGGTSTCAYTYGAWGTCQANGTQTRTVLSSTPSGCTGTPVLSQACPVTPPACTYATGAWGACQPDGTQTRTVTGSPSGCVGTPPASSQSCTYVPPVVTCTGFTFTAWAPATCPASGQQTRTVITATPTGCTGGNPALTQSCTYVPPVVTCTGFTYGAWTPAVCPASGQQTRAVATSSPAGCTGGSPIVTQVCTYVPPPPATCTSFTYSALTPAVCPSSGQQTRTVVSSAPAGCTGGTPVLTVACTYVPPPPATCTSFTYSALTPAVCPASGQQTRTVVSSAPAGCTGGTPVLTVACTYAPDGAALYGSKCASCHGALASSTKAGRTAAQITAANMTQGLSAVEVQAVADALAKVTPPLDGAALYTQYCAGCHGNGKKGSSVSAIQGAISGNKGGMGSLSSLTAAQLQAISAAP